MGRSKRGVNVESIRPVKKPKKTQNEAEIVASVAEFGGDPSVAAIDGVAECRDVSAVADSSEVAECGEMVAVAAEVGEVGAVAEEIGEVAEPGEMAEVSEVAESEIAGVEPEPVLTIVASSGGGKQLCDGFMYYVNKRTETATYWECILRKPTATNIITCRAKATTTESGGILQLVNHSAHTHAPRTETLLLKQARDEIRAVARTTHNKPCQILQAQRTSAGVTARLLAPNMPTKNALRKVISYVRHKEKPKEPRSIVDINVPEDLQLTISGKRFLHRDIDVRGEKLLLFTTEEDMRHLERAEYWMADGTFKTAPSMFMQLFTIHGCVGGANGEVLPLVYAMMTHRTNECYDDIMQALSEIADEYNIVLNPKYVLSDFETAEMKSFVREFPNVQSKGCLFHLRQNIYKKILFCGLAQRYGNDLEFSLHIRQLYALAFLPADEIEAAYFVLKPTFEDCVKPLLEWFEPTYIVGKKRRRSQVTRTDAMFPPAIWSVYDNVLNKMPRTQNKVESWHNRWQHLVGNKPGTYEIISHLKAEEHKVRCDSQRALAGIAPPINKDQQKRDENILRILQNRGSKTAFEFLYGIAHNITL